MLSKSGEFANNNHKIQYLCKQGNIKLAFQAFSNEPNPTIRTYETLILACSAQNAAVYGRIVHRYIVQDGLDGDCFLSTRLIDMYSRFDALEDARRVFDASREKDVYLWNAFLRALAIAGKGEEALEIYGRMGQSVGIEFDSFSYSYALKACVVPLSQSSTLSFERVRKIHGHIIRHGYQSLIYVATTLVDVYAKLSHVGYARMVFDGMLEKNVVTWSAMIGCYAKNEMEFEALQVFGEMMTASSIDRNIIPNSVTIISILQACSGLSAMEIGKVIHAYVLRRRLDSVISVSNTLLSMYAKSGNLDMSRRIFDQLGDRRDVISWTAMVSGLGMHGHASGAIDCFHQMLRAGVFPSPITFLSVLGACSHAGLVKEGKEIFELMTNGYHIIPGPEHYASMVDLLGRAGRLDEAANIISAMRIEPGPTVWGSLLGACRIHRNVELAERACVRLFKLEPTNAGNYMLLSNIYFDAGMWEKVAETKSLLAAHALQKMAGCSFIEVRRRVYSFVSVDEANPHIEQLNALLLQIMVEMKREMPSYTPQTNVVMYDVEEEVKERILLGHSEKLAVAFGLINTNAGDVIRITKNLRLCEDCHSVTKFVSKLANREILVRDVNRFHRFRDGVCSCGDYW